MAHPAHPAAPPSHVSFSLLLFKSEQKKVNKNERTSKVEHTYDFKTIRYITAGNY